MFAEAAGPVELAALGVVAGPDAHIGDDEEVLAAEVGAGGLPDLFARSLIERDQVAVAVVVAVNDDFVLEDDRRAAKAMHAGEAAWLDEPFLVAVKVVSGDDHVAGSAAPFHLAVRGQ